VARSPLKRTSLGRTRCQVGRVGQPERSWLLVASSWAGVSDGPDVSVYRRPRPWDPVSGPFKCLCLTCMHAGHQTVSLPSSTTLRQDDPLVRSLAERPCAASWGLTTEGRYAMPWALCHVIHTSGPRECKPPRCPTMPHASAPSLTSRAYPLGSPGPSSTVHLPSAHQRRIYFAPELTHHVALCQAAVHEEVCAVDEARVVRGHCGQLWRHPPLG